MKTLALSSVLSFILILGCRPNHSAPIGGSPASGHAPSVPRSQISQSEVSSGACLNVGTYSSLISQLYPDPAIQHITSDFHASATGHLSHNFVLRAAAGIFAINTINRNQMPELANLSQSDCSSVTMIGANGDGQLYQVTSSTPTSLSMSDIEGDSYSYQWLSPTSVKTTTEMIVGDLCDEDSKITLHTENVYSWDTIPLADALPAGTISPDFLALVAEAHGVTTDSLFALATANSNLNELPSKQLSRTALINLQTLPLKESLDTCN